jgi:hypothetical protein
MADFMFVYRTNPGAFGSMTPGDVEQHMQKWHTWLTEALQKGWMVSPGDGLKQEGKVVTAKKVVTDGPFVESKEIVGGFSIVRAETLEAAAELAKGCPCLLVGGNVEVRPLEGFVLAGTAGAGGKPH